MKDLIWAFLERVFPRIASALVMLGMTFFISPSTVGIYALAILVVTFFQSATDAAIRQIAVPALRTEIGRDFLARYSKRTPIVGALFTALPLAAIYITLPADTKAEFIPVFIFVLIPTVTARRVTTIAYHQKCGNWKALAKFQLIAALLSFLVSVPVLLITHSLLAPALQLFITELGFTILSRRALAECDVKEDSQGESEIVQETHNPHREFVHLSLYSMVAWIQTQADRVIMGPLAGAARLGEYTVATSIARSAGDAISTSTANVLRPRLFNRGDSEAATVRSGADAILLKSTPIAAAATATTIAGIELVLRPLLDNEWDSSLDAAIILSLTTGPTLFAWCMTVILIAAKRIRWAAPIKMIGALCALPIAFAAVQSIQYAATLAVVREVLVLGLLTLVARRYTPWISLCMMLGLYTTLTTIVALLLGT
ncbi:Polysaccharide biosynthesis protein [Rhodococcus gordoniae]|uniref:Polysaccharide biosynthesis protein n=1 Tax=Rhodococcus gordoniae TaxID=223392 RepID=A0A379M0V4_9NOCA|nr:oligosaccharide flippase family protein [Rhodococcus gordoniae]SUE15386.1 Polysaccharide biosynthesis protein [Rhodococcus gordoniae]